MTIPKYIVDESFDTEVTIVENKGESNIIPQLSSTPIIARESHTNSPKERLAQKKD